jgi:hypothetical protein
MEELRACVEGGAAAPAAIGADRTVPGSFNALIVQYLRSAKYANLKPSTKATYNGIIRRSREKHGHRMVAELRFQHVEATPIWPRINASNKVFVRGGI